MVEIKKNKKLKRSFDWILHRFAHVRTRGTNETIHQVKICLEIMTRGHISFLQKWRFAATHSQLLSNISIHQLHVFNNLAEPTLQTRHVDATIAGHVIIWDHKSRNFCDYIIGVYDSEYAGSTLLQLGPELIVTDSGPTEGHHWDHRRIFEGGGYIVRAENRECGTQAMAGYTYAKWLVAVRLDHSRNLLPNHVLQTGTGVRFGDIETQKTVLHHAILGSTTHVVRQFCQGNTKIFQPFQTRGGSSKSNHHVTSSQPCNFLLVFTDRYVTNPAWLHTWQLRHGRNPTG